MPVPSHLSLPNLNEIENKHYLHYIIYIASYWYYIIWFPLCVGMEIDRPVRLAQAD